MPPSELEALWGRFEQTLYIAACAALDAFVAKHRQEVWYGFIFDCNADYGDILLCLNTEEDLARQIRDRYSNYEQAELDRLRWNAGDWKFQGFESSPPARELWEREWERFRREVGIERGDLTGELKERLEGDDEFNEHVDREVNEHFLCSACRVLLRMEESGVFETLRKSEDFGTFVNDHDETDSDSWDRLTGIRLEVAPPWKQPPPRFRVQGRHPGLADSLLNQCALRLDAGARDQAAVLAAEAFRLDAELLGRYTNRRGWTQPPREFVVNGTSTVLPAPEEYAWACALVARSMRASFDISSTRYADLARALELDPKNVVALERRADGYKGNAQFEENGEELLSLAVSDLTQAVGLDPGNAQLLRQRAQVHVHGKRRDYAGVVADLESAMRLDRATFDDHRWIAFAHDRLGHAEEAVAHYNEAVALAAQRSAWHVALLLRERGRCLHRLGRFEEAIRDFTRAIEGGEMEAPLLVYRCKAFEALGRTEEAAADKKAALKRDKKAFEIWGEEL